MRIDIAARLKPLDEFLIEAEAQDIVKWRGANGKTLIFSSVSGSQGIRYENTAYLLSQGVDATVALKDGTTCLHYFVAVLRPKMVESNESDVELLRLLLEAGADINAVSARYGSPVQQFCMTVVNSPSEETLRPYYDVLFDDDRLDLTSPSGWGRSVYQSIVEMGKPRPIIREYAERYLTERGIPIPS